jgi:hypothetical protein
MADANATPPTPEPLAGAPRFPFLTAAAALAVLFLFVGLVVWLYGRPNPLGDPKTEPGADPAERLRELRAKNQDVLDGKGGAKMSVSAATAELLKTLNGPKDVLPFPVPDTTAPPGPKKK